MRTIASLTAFLCGLAAGLALGYGLGIALAPTDGPRARSRLLDEARVLGAQPAEIAERARLRVETAVDEGRRAAAEKRRELSAEVGLDRSAPEIPARDLPV